MEKIEFIKKTKEAIESLDMKIEEKDLEKFYKYKGLLIEYNKKINLTAITEDEEIINKHFLDSVTINKYLLGKKSFIDIGTGAGFPGIPLKIINKEIEATLLDSLNKRVSFLEETIKELDLKNVVATHARAEDFLKERKERKERERYDVATSRAVAKLNVLVEYMLPAVKVGGKCICMKGNNIEEEIEEAKTAIEILGGKIEEVEKITLPNTDIERNIIIIKKTKNTPLKYPRKAGTPQKEPLK